MIAHAEYHATYPLPYGTMLPPTAYPVAFCPVTSAKAARTIQYDMGDEPKDSDKRIAAMKATRNAARLVKFSAMDGKDRMRQGQVAVLLNVACGSVRQQLKKLVASGHVTKETIGCEVFYKWI